MGLESLEQGTAILGQGAQPRGEGAADTSLGSHAHGEQVAGQIWHKQHVVEGHQVGELDGPAANGVCGLAIAQCHLPGIGEWREAGKQLVVRGHVC